MTGHRPFDVYGELPSGQVVIEASAGTGKTFTLSTLATRFLAERDLAPSELLIVTFTRAATAELRSRIRGQMAATAEALAGGPVPPGAADLTALLADVGRDDCRGRLERAVSEFDSVAISTMHSFAAQVRSTLRISTAVDPDARLTSDVSEMVRHACADALATAAVTGVPVGELPSLANLVKATERYLRDPDMHLEPGPEQDGAEPAQIRLRDLVLAAEANLLDRRLTAGTMGFDDILGELRAALTDPSSAAVVAALRRRFSVVLIDEFQDTDRVQWEIFSTLFGGRDGDNALVLVGDPKQAIYRFRGADISVYLEAVTSTQAAGRFTLDRNWRSDGAAIEAMGRTFSGATFGNDAIGFVPVRASDEHEPQRMRGPDRSPLSGLAIRVAVGDQLPRSGNFPITPLAARIVHSDMVAHVRNLLDGATIPDPDAAGGERALLPRDIAVLVTSGGHARAAQNALRHQGIPAVVSGAGSVLSSWAADQVRVLLAAMERPADLRRVRAYSLSWFEAWSPRRVATSTDDDLAELQRKLTDWSARLADEPVAEVLAAVWADTDVVARVLGRFDGDRNVTDLDHLAELLHDNAPQGRSGVPGLLAFLDDPPESEGDLETDGDVVARRIESQAEAVQIMTIWKAKGLQFPVVCLPMLWRPGKAPEDVVYTDPETGRRTMDLAKGTNWPDPTRAAARKALAREEEASESLRLVYVALTRAQHHTAVWWANARGSKSRALSRFLFARRPGDGTLDPGVFASGSCTIPPESAIPARLAELAEGTHGTVTVTVVPEPGPESGRAAPWRPPGRQAGEDPFEIATLSVVPDRSAHRWSFSAITATAEDVRGDPYDVTGADRGADDETAEADAGAGQPAYNQDGGVAGSLTGLRAGTDFGTFVHSVLERTDFTSPDLTVALEDAVDEVFRRTGTAPSVLAPDDVDGRALLVAGLADAVRSPLGPLFDDTGLVDLDRRDRLDELAFELRVGQAGRRPEVRELGDVVLRHLPDDHPLRAWAAALAEGALDVRLAGHLTGSIDLVARRRTEDGADRFVVADYKSNRLTPPATEPAPSDYARGPLAGAMGEHHYPLQALLYGVALHRYLRSRQRPGASPAEVTGAAYLFVRGMTGPGVGRDGLDPYGVFTWEFAPGLLDEASAFLDGAPIGAAR